MPDKLPSPLSNFRLVGGTAATPGSVGLSISATGLVRMGSTNTTGRPIEGFASTTPTAACLPPAPWATA
ncbi:hypothetical protein [Hymenobacter chitinivorans]|uniref:hypothetical protein n=1 Tax=Hymenobacter chitinivorans TaxID=89969 RepID=UPI0012FDA3A4|nr:hypothetical protein [Hymenobacter chitinivorans]